MPHITASMLYDLVACPHRVALDLFGDPRQRDEVSPFVRLLWEKGALHEERLIKSQGIPILDLSRFSGDEKERRTSEAMARGEPFIYGGRIQVEDLLGDPDLLRREGTGYVAGDIKSGAGLEGSEDLNTPKLHYAVQVALYTDILERKGCSAGRRPFIWDIHGEEVLYDLDAPLGIKNPTTLWNEYLQYLAEARQIAARQTETRGAYGSICKQCYWYTSCVKELEGQDDLTLIPELGRSRRDAMVEHVPNVSALAQIEVAQFIRGKKTIFSGIGPATLEKFYHRARLVKGPDPRPYLTQPVTLPHSDLEIFFDIEVDPMRDTCYLHGMVERHRGDNGTERYVSFFASDTSAEAERDAFAEAWQYFTDRPSAVIYYYSKYERTIWRKLRQKYSDVCSEADVEALFEPQRAIDLYYDVVMPRTEWPTRDYSIKTLARYLGFAWRDTNPSGAASIEWFDRWIETGDLAVKQRILDYNEDDCRATRVLLDGIRGLA